MSADLHTHSSCSDGTDSPSSLVENAWASGVTALALTDHDTLAGLAEASAAARRVGLTLIPGVELSCGYPHGELHLLGLGFDPARVEPLRRTLTEAKRSRAARNRRMVTKAQRAGVAITYQDLLAVAGSGSPGRPHMARLLVKRGVVDSIEEAFSRYLARGQQFFSHRQPLDLEAATAAIHAAGGLALIAHPRSLKLSPTRLEGFLSEAREVGLDGIEVWHPSHSRGLTRALEELAGKLGLAVSGGSDYHGDLSPGRRLGMVGTDEFLPDQVAAGFQRVSSDG